MQESARCRLERAVGKAAIVLALGTSNNLSAAPLLESTESRVTITTQMVADSGELTPRSGTTSYKSENHITESAINIVTNAISLIGIRYRWGGNNPDGGLDCSGFVRYVFHEAFGFLLPRQAAAMSKAGAPIPSTELRPGDLVFFNTMHRAFSHVGIYIGKNKFVHAPSTGSQVRIDDIRLEYWRQRFEGARRIEYPHFSAQIGD